jgi:hypothetical protein
LQASVARCPCSMSCAAVHRSGSQPPWALSLIQHVIPVVASNIPDVYANHPGVVSVDCSCAAEGSTPARAAATSPQSAGSSEHPGAGVVRLAQRQQQHHHHHHQQQQAGAGAVPKQHPTASLPGGPATGSSPGGMHPPAAMPAHYSRAAAAAAAAAGAVAGGSGGGLSPGVLLGQHAGPRPQLAAAPQQSPEGLGSAAAAGGDGGRGSTGRPPHVSTLSTASAPRPRQRTGELLLSGPAQHAHGLLLTRAWGISAAS